MPAPKGRTVDSSALALAPIGSAVAGDVGQPTLAIEGGVLSRTEVGEKLDCGIRESALCGPVRRAGGDDRISKGDEVLFSHFGVGVERFPWMGSETDRERKDGDIPGGHLVVDPCRNRPIGGARYRVGAMVMVHGHVDVASKGADALGTRHGATTGEPEPVGQLARREAIETGEEDARGEGGLVKVFRGFHSCWRLVEGCGLVDGATIARKEYALKKYFASFRKSLANGNFRPEYFSTDTL